MSEAGGGRDVHPQGMQYEEDQELLTPDLTVSSNADTDMYMDASEGEAEMEASGDESGEEGFDEAHSTLHLDISHLQGRELSPVAEVSPEAVSIGSTESLDRNCVDLESELNIALSQLSNLTVELAEVEQSIVGSRQTKITETVTITSVPNARQEGDGSRKSSSETAFEGKANLFVV